MLLSAQQILPKHLHTILAFGFVRICLANKQLWMTTEPPWALTCCQQASSSQTNCRRKGNFSICHLCSHEEDKCA